MFSFMLKVKTESEPEFATKTGNKLLYWFLIIFLVFILNWNNDDALIHTLLIAIWRMVAPMGDVYFSLSPSW